MKEIDVSWILKGKLIHREVLFEDFIEAFSFMTPVAIVAKKLGHHPDWKNVYNKVNFVLNTHDADGLTNKDFQLAKKIDRILKTFVQ